MTTTTIVESLKDFSTLNGHKFNYGSNSVHNLVGHLNALAVDQVFVALLPVTEDVFTNTFGAVERVTYSGEMLVVKKSDIDTGSGSQDGLDYYQEKYDATIKHLKLLAKTSLIDALRCDGFELRSFKIREIVNTFATNYDGIYITFQGVTVAPDLINP